MCGVQVVSNTHLSVSNTYPDVWDAREGVLDTAAADVFDSLGRFTTSVARRSFSSGKGFMSMVQEDMQGCLTHKKHSPP